MFVGCDTGVGIKAGGRGEVLNGDGGHVFFRSTPNWRQPSRALSRPTVPLLQLHQPKRNSAVVMTMAPRVVTILVAVTGTNVVAVAPVVAPARAVIVTN